MNIEGFGSFLADMPQRTVKIKKTTSATKTDTEFTHDGITYTQRVWRNTAGKFIRGDLFVGGWKRSQYKTEAGLQRAVNKIKNSK